MTKTHVRITLAATLASSVLLGGNLLTTVAAHAATPSSQGAIIDGLFEEPANLNPILGPDQTFSDIVETSMFSNLFTVTPNNQLVPNLATVVPTIANGGISKNGLTYTFHLKPNAKWSNGQPVTSKDVWITYKIITNPLVNAVSTLGWTDVASFHTVNPKTFVIHLKKPDPSFIDNVFSGNLPGILPYSVFGKMSPKNVNTATFNHAPTVSDGPFKFVSWVPGASITVTANPYWYGPKPKSKEIIFKIIPSQDTLLTNAQAHALNVWYFDPIEAVPQIQAIPGATLHFANQPSFEMAVVNLKNPILDNVKVRQALEMAINRQAIVQDIWKGHAKLLAADQPAMAWSYNPNLKPYPYNPTEAKTLLAQAGWKMGSNGYLQKNGKTFRLVYSTTAGNAYREATERLLQFWLKQVGIQLVIRNYPANEFFGTVLPSGKGWDLGEFEYGDSTDPTFGPYQLFTSMGAQNFGQYNNPQVDKLFAQQSVLTSLAQRKAIMNKVEAIFHQQLPALWFYAPQQIDTTIGMTGYVPNPWGVDTWNCYDWALTK
ncbi:peptide ABC transporter substrate-binding protein [Ferroacidibacillus organovorans]|uniref:Solute-binding protein family 5 domain-containing protein n=1 Tax=Ferroacidibacillus organovorans TaxID=1765683 RepID=A0A101XRS2_9BACL|nr:peptide ABC transporter substrate-binding protein [Ferroacidibacillus organovorans]KUO96330.1 hypothetical protein ATW55_03755 [Ferroacidibacillus organovorans]